MVNNVLESVKLAHIQTSTSKHNRIFLGFARVTKTKLFDWSVAKPGLVIRF